MTKQDWELGLFIGLLVVLAYQGGAAVMDAVGGSMQTVADKLAYAIAQAEGFFVAGSRPQRNHNPGDLERDITGTGIGTDGPYVVYASDFDGWAALTQQTQMMLDGTSHVYKPSMTIAEMASHYTATDQSAWAANVASQLGVTVDTPLSEIPA